MFLFGKQRRMKNKYATKRGKKSKQLKEFMHKVEVWLPTKTYNKLRDQALLQDSDMAQLAANGLYRVINTELYMTTPWYIKILTEVNENCKVSVEILSKFILATLRTGISQDDIMMNGFDSNLDHVEIVNALNWMVRDGYIEIDKHGIIRYKFYGTVDKANVVGRFKGKKVDSSKLKVKPKIESLVTKQPRRTHGKE